MHKTLVVVQCRYTSTRLKGKVLYPLCGIPMLTFLLKRLQNGLPLENYNIILATTKNEEDDILDIWGKHNHIEVLRGEEDDVLKRYIQCLQRYPSELIVRVTADNPLTCPNILKACVSAMKATKTDYVQSKGCPIGVGVDVFTSEVLQIMDNESGELYEREHINAFVLNHSERFKIHFFEVLGTIARPDLSMTVDTRHDWEKVNALFSVEDREPWRISLEEAIKRMDSSFASE